MAMRLPGWFLAIAVVMAAGGCGDSGAAGDAADVTAFDTVDATPDETDGDATAEATPPCSGLVVTPVAPTPPAPCGEDLDAVTGAVLPDVGDVACRGAYAHDPAETGPFAVVETDGQVANPVLEHDAIVVRTYLGEHAADLGPVPLVIVLHGFGATLEAMVVPSRHLSSHGLAVVAMTFPNTGFTEPPAHDLKVVEVRAVMDWALGASSPLAGKVDASKVAIAGHSMGGKIAFWTAAEDPRVDLVVGLDPNNSGGPPCAMPGGDCNAFPVAPNCAVESSGVLAGLHAESLVFAAEDPTLTPDVHLRAVHFYRGAPTPAYLLHFPTAGHAEWSKDGDVTHVTDAVVTALLLTRFEGYSGLEAWLPPRGDQVTALLGGMLDRASAK
jgi:pimeloyl-ACP methyl ester carboxylesterase